MTTHRFFSSRFSDVFWVGMSLLTASVVSLYLYHYISIDKGFDFRPKDGVVVRVDASAGSPRLGLEPNDRLLRIGEVNVPERLAAGTGDVLRDLRTGEPTSVVVLRDGEKLEITIQARTGLFLDPERVTVIFSAALFWLAATMAGIFLRPRDFRWLILILCFYVTAMWLTSGVVSASQVGYSSVVFHFLIWIFSPLYIHLHLILPSAPFRRFHHLLLPALYSSMAFLSVLDFLKFFSYNFFYWPFLFAVTVSIGLVAYRLFERASPAIEVAERLVFFGVVMGLGPAFTYLVLAKYVPYAVFVEEFGGWANAIFLGFLPIWPLTYVYAIYKHDLGTIKYRANRFLGTYGFLAVFMTVYLVSFAALASSEAFGRAPFSLSCAMSLLFIVIVPYCREKFQLLIDRHVFGIRHTPNEVMSAFAKRIPTAYNRSVLRYMIGTEILPTLLIRQSALYHFGDQELETICELDVPTAPRANRGEVMKGLLGFSGRYLPLDEAIHPDYSWVRLVVPLVFQEEIVGIWLFGQRDPDDYYPQNDIELLTNLANQIAPVIENVRLVEIARHELEENKRLQQQLLHSQKMEAIGSLSAGIAHDFNNLLSVILGNSYLLLDDYVDEEGEVGRFLGEIRDAGERAAGLTRQLLTFSRQSEMEVRVVSLSDVVEEMAQMLRLLAGKEVDLKLHLGKDLPFVRVDPGQIGQVIVNLVVNARDAMPEGGTLTLEISKIDHTQSGIFAQVDMEPGPYVWLQVADTGTGLDPDIRSRIFEPFFTTKEAGKGTGLGLSMVYGIVNQSHGHVFVESEGGEGTSFHIFLPAVTGEEQALEGASPAERETLAGEETVLVVEDERGVREVTCMILRSHGYRILEAAGGEEGLKISAAYDGKIDLLLTDVVMPKMQGPALARELAQSRPELKVLFMSGYHDDSHFARHAGDGQPDVLQKPFSPQELCRRVRESLDAGLAVSSSQR